MTFKYGEDWYQRKERLRIKSQMISHNYKESPQRIRLFELLGTTCRCKNSKCWHEGKCKVSNRCVLQFDHINGGGSKERKEKNGMSMYDYYLQHPEEAKQNLQVLCANCNWMKKYVNHEECYIPF